MFKVLLCNHNKIMFIQVSHYNNIAFISDVIQKENIEPVSIDPRPYHLSLSPYLKQKSEIKNREEAENKFNSNRQTKTLFNDHFCINCDCYVPFGYYCKYCDSDYCNTCYKIYDIEKKYCPICFYL